MYEIRVSLLIIQIIEIGIQVKMMELLQWRWNPLPKLLLILQAERNEIRRAVLGFYICNMNVISTPVVQFVKA